MRKLIAALALCAATILSGCADYDAPEPVALASVAPATTTIIPTLTADAEFLTLLRAADLPDVDTKAATYIDVAASICSALRSGATPTGMVDFLASDPDIAQTFTRTQLTALVSASQTVYCSGVTA